MRKLFISGLIIFAIFFISGTVTWFAFDKAKYENKTIIRLLIIISVSCQ